MWEQVHSYFELIVSKALTEKREFESEIEVPARLLMAYDRRWSAATLKIKIDLKFDGVFLDDGSKPTNPAASRERH